jgi:hypothetical protein
MSDVSSIGGCKNLKNLNLNFKGDRITPDLSMLSSCNELSDLTISGCAPYNFNSKIENINGIKLAKNLISIKIDGVKITGEDGRSLSNANPKIKPKSLDKGYIPRVDVEELTDVGDVTHYRGVPFTGIMYSNFGSHLSGHNNKSRSMELEKEYEMVKGFKHGSYKHFYAGGKLAGKLRIEHNFVDDKHEIKYDLLSSSNSVEAIKLFTNSASEF